MPPVNRPHCTCSYTACPTWGDCSACVPKHCNRGEIPGCFFSTEAERSYDRSIARFIKDQ